MSSFVINRPNPGRVDWHCTGAGCIAAAVTGPASTKTPWHPCPAVGGALVPLTRVGERVQVSEVPREDYVAGELVQRAPDGRVLGAAKIERLDGSNDTIVYAPAATATASELEDARDDDR